MEGIRNKQLFFYQAECGDAARIRYLGNDGNYHNIFIDSGYRNTFRKILNQHVIDIEHSGERIDLWIISHIHDDHIGGVEQYLAQIETGESKDIVDAWLFNSPRLDNNDRWSVNDGKVSSTMSIRQADKLTTYLKHIGKLPETDCVSNSHAVEFYGLKIYILSPSINKLNKLRDKYANNPEIPLERLEGESVSFATSTKESDYHIKLNDFNLNRWQEDDSIENGSSISVLTEYGDSRVLWLADSHPTDVVDSLSKLGYSNENKLKCEWVKVSHHGSVGNNNDNLYDLINCKNFLFSADGVNKHKLPRKETIARILRNKNRNKYVRYELYFTYDNEVLRSIFFDESEGDLVELKFALNFHDDGDFIFKEIKSYS